MVDEIEDLMERNREALLVDKSRCDRLLEASSKNGLIGVAATGSESDIISIVSIGKIVPVNPKRDGIGLLHIAAARGLSTLTNVLLRRGVDVDDEAWPEPHRERDPIWSAVTQNTSRVGIAWPENRGPWALTPLHVAIDAGHPTVVETLLAAGADPHLTVSLDCGKDGRYNWTALELALQRPGRGPADLVVSMLRQACERVGHDWSVARNKRLPSQ